MSVNGYAERYRNLMGPASAEYIDALKADIAKRGLLVPIEIDEENVILDGHLRLEIAHELGIDVPKPKVRRDFLTEEQKIEHVLKRNLLQREPGPVSWGNAFGQLLEARGVSRKPGPNGDSATVALIAGELGISRRTAFRRLQLAGRLSAHPKLARLVDVGQLTEREALNQVGANGISKPLLANGTSHPARYSTALLPVFADFLDGATTVLDPFAGTGRIHELEEYGYETVGVEIEPEWAELHDRTEVGDALELRFKSASFDAICTSPTFGNRMADHHDAKDASTRRSYRHDLGRALHPHNSGKLQWGDAYRDFHERAWKEVSRVLRPKGIFVLNIKDHFRNKKREFVAGWHVTTMCRLGFTLREHEEVDTPAMRAGENSDARVPEQVYAFTKDVR